MTGTLRIEDGSRRLAELELQGVSGYGRLNPRLRLSFTVRPVPPTSVILTDVTLRLEHGLELLGEGRVVELHPRDGSQVIFEIAVPPRLLRYVTDSLAPTTAAIQLDATLQGIARACLDSDTSTSPGRAGLSSDCEQGQWTEFEATVGPSALWIPRSAWYERVLAPTRNEQYRFLEVALPRDDNALRAEWGAAVRNLDDAESSYASGDDPAVFFYLRAALDALPGAKTQILDGISNEDKRRRLDDLLKRAGDFLHNGRHVAKTGEQAGTFPVDHMDAAFALDLMRVLLSHLSLMLAAERQRAYE